MTGEEVDGGGINVNVLRRKDKLQRGGRQHSKRCPQEAYWSYVRVCETARHSLLVLEQVKPCT